jgi:hypothetical protein
MKRNEVKLLAVVATSAVVTAGVLGVAAGQERAGAGSVASSGMSTGVTVTATTPPTEPANAVAVPGIKGPAPLPSEEQGLPG